MLPEQLEEMVPAVMSRISTTKIDEGSTGALSLPGPANCWVGVKSSDPPELVLPAEAPLELAAPVELLAPLEAAPVAPAVAVAPLAPEEAPDEAPEPLVALVPLLPPQAAGSERTPMDDEL